MFAGGLLHCVKHSSGLTVITKEACRDAVSHEPEWLHLERPKSSWGRSLAPVAGALPKFFNFTVALQGKCWAAFRRIGGLKLLSFHCETGSATLPASNLLLCSMPFMSQLTASNETGSLCSLRVFPEAWESNTGAPSTRNKY